MFSSREEQARSRHERAERRNRFREQEQRNATLAEQRNATLAEQRNVTLARNDLIIGARVMTDAIKDFNDFSVAMAIRNSSVLSNKRVQDQKQRYKTFVIVNHSLERIITRELLVQTQNGIKSIVPFMESVRMLDASLRNGRKLAELHPKEWIHMMVVTALEESLATIDRLYMQSTSQDPIVVAYQRKMTAQKIKESIQSPIFEELTQRFTHPINYTNGWFEKMDLLDEDGFME